MGDETLIKETQKTCAAYVGSRARFNVKLKELCVKSNGTLRTYESRKNVVTEGQNEEVVVLPEVGDPIDSQGIKMDTNAKALTEDEDSLTTVETKDMGELANVENMKRIFELENSLEELEMDSQNEWANVMLKRESIFFNQGAKCKSKRWWKRPRLKLVGSKRRMRCAWERLKRSIKFECGRNWARVGDDRSCGEKEVNPNVTSRVN
jgi:hypothetical protein